MWKEERFCHRISVHHFSTSKQQYFILGYGFNGTVMCIRHYIIYRPLVLTLLCYTSYIMCPTWPCTQSEEGYGSRLVHVAVLVLCPNKWREQRGKRMQKERSSLCKSVWEKGAFGLGCHQSLSQSCLKVSWGCWIYGRSSLTLYTDFFSLGWDLRGSESMIYTATLSAIQEGTYQRESTLTAKESK